MRFCCSYGAQSRTIQGIKPTLLPWQTSISYRFLHILSCPFLQPSSPAVSFEHQAVNHSVGEYVRNVAHPNGIESFWSMLKRGYVGVFHQLSAKHLDRYGAEFAGRHNIRLLDTLDMMLNIVVGIVGKRLPYKTLVA